jgi:hypothetical protein
MNQKLKDVFKGKVVNKALTINTGVDEFPRYVVEYLIDNYCSEETFHADMEKVVRRLKENFVHAAEAEKIRHYNRTAGGSLSLNNLTVRQTTFPLNIGGQPQVAGLQYAGGFADGYMDEIRVWTKTRTAREIQESRFCRLTGTEPGLVGYWNFDSGLVSDLTNNRQNGTLMGNAQVTPIMGADLLHAGVCGSQLGFQSDRSRFSPVQGFRLKLLGPQDRAARLEASTDLLHWEAIVGFPDLGDSIELIDSSATNFMKRFYRAVVP